MKLKVVKQFKDKNDHKTIYQVGDVINIKEVERVTNLIKRDLCIPIEDEEKEATTAEAQPKTDPAEAQPKTDPAEEKPETDPAEAQPKTDPAEEKPEADPAEEKPEAEPAEEKPEADPAEEKPKRGTRKSGKAESKQEE